jgi:hypothetical protein
MKKTTVENLVVADPMYVVYEEQGEITKYCYVVEICKPLSGVNGKHADEVFSQLGITEQIAELCIHPQVFEVEGQSFLIDTRNARAVYLQNISTPYTEEAAAAVCKETGIAMVYRCMGREAAFAVDLGKATVSEVAKTSYQEVDKLKQEVFLYIYFFLLDYDHFVESAEKRAKEGFCQLAD